MAGTVRSGRRLMSVIDEKHAFTRFDISNLDPIRKPRPLIGSVTLGVAIRERGVG